MLGETEFSDADPVENSTLNMLNFNYLTQKVKIPYARNRLSCNTELPLDDSESEERTETGEWVYLANGGKIQIRRGLASKWTRGSENLLFLITLKYILRDQQQSLLLSCDLLLS